MRCGLACVDWVLRLVLRGPVPVLAATVFVALAAVQPELGEPRSDRRLTGRLAGDLGVGAVVLLGTALALPRGTVALRVLRPPGGAGPRPKALGVAIGQGLTLLLVGVLLAAASGGMLRVREGPFDTLGRPGLRRCLGTFPAARESLRSVGDHFEFSVPLLGLPKEKPEVLLRLNPDLKWDPHQPTETSGRSMTSTLEVRWKPRGSAAWKAKTVLLTRRGAETVSLDLPRMMSAREHGDLAVEIVRSGGGQAPIFNRETVVVLGAKAHPVSSLVRGFLLVALWAGAVASVCQWFSGFVSYPVALLAALTVALVVGWVAWDRLGLVDPGERVLQGASVRWIDLVAPVLAWASTLLLHGGLPWVDRRVVEGGS